MSGLLFVREEDVRRVITMDSCINAVEDAYRELGEKDGSITPRQNLWIVPPKSIKLASAGLVHRGFMGIVAYSAGYGARGSGSSSTLLYDISNGKLLAIVESKLLGLYRTGATTAVAAKYLANKGSEVVAIIGTGRQARTQILALRNVLGNLRTVRAFSRTREKRENFAAEMTAETGLDVQPTDSPEECATKADVVVTITTSNLPLIKKEWISNGTLICALGSHYPSASEVDIETVLSSTVIVDSKEQALLEKGEILIPIKKGLTTPDIIRAELGEIVAKKTNGRSSPDEKVLFCSGGIASEQIGVAAEIYERVVKLGSGVHI